MNKKGLLFSLFIKDKLLSLIEHISQTTLSTILTVVMGGHEDPGSTLFGGTLASQAMNFSIVINAVIFAGRQAHFLMLVFNLLGSGVVLLLALFSTST